MTLKEKQETATAWTKYQEHKRSELSAGDHAELTEEQRAHNRELMAKIRLDLEAKGVLNKRK